MNPASRAIAIGIDIGATNVKGVVVDDRDGSVRAHNAVALEGRPAPDVAREVVWQLERTGDAATVGVAAPGIAGADGRSIWWMQGRLAELQGVDWSAVLERSSPVPVINDAQAALLGEVWKGAAAGCANVIMLTLGTGVGGAAMVDGKLLRGHLGRAGHLGHISLDPRGPLDIVNTPGSLEEAIGDCTIERRTGGAFRSTLELVKRSGESRVALETWANSIRALACGLASLVNVLDPEMIVIGGGISAAGDKLFVPLAVEMEKVEWRPHGREVRIVPAALGEYAGAIGAAWNAMQRSGEST